MNAQRTPLAEGRAGNVRQPAAPWVQHGEMAVFGCARCPGYDPSFQSAETHGSGLNSRGAGGKTGPDHGKRWSGLVGGEMRSIQGMWCLPKDSIPPRGRLLFIRGDRRLAPDEDGGRADVSVVSGITLLCRCTL